MNLIKVVDGVASEYTINQLRKDNPNTSFPKEPSETLLASYDVYIYTIDPMPDGDVVTLAGFEKRDGQWFRVWDVVNYTPEEKRQRMRVTMRQARLALHQAGKLDLVADAINLIPEPDKSLISIEWEYASTVERMSPWMGVMGSALGLSEEELDQLFEIAKGL